LSMRESTIAARWMSGAASGVLASMTWQRQANSQRACQHPIDLPKPALQTHIVIIAVWTEFVTLFVRGHVFAECFLALFAGKHHFGRPRESMVLALFVARGTIKPLLAARRADGDLCVEDVFTVSAAEQEPDRRATASGPSRRVKYTCAAPHASRSHSVSNSGADNG